MATTDYLKQAKVLVANGWCQGSYTRDSHGTPSHFSRTSASWCIQGSVIEACRLSDSNMTEEVLDLLREAIGLEHWDLISKWNDEKDRTQEEVLQVFDAAIVLAEKDQ